MGASCGARAPNTHFFQRTSSQRAQPSTNSGAAPANGGSTWSTSALDGLYGAMRSGEVAVLLSTA